jgi:hypothetical protein
MGLFPRFTWTRRSRPAGFHRFGRNLHVDGLMQVLVGLQFKCDTSNVMTSLQLLISMSLVEQILIISH